MRHIFHAVKKREYTIVRDYYVSNNHLQGVYFVLYDEQTNEIVTRFLRKELIHNEEIWKKKSFFNSTHQQMKVEKGTENKLVVETGVLTTKKTNALGTPTEKKKHAERIIFYLKNPNT